MQLITESENDEETKNIFNLVKHSKDDIIEEDNCDTKNNLKEIETVSNRKNKNNGNMFYLKKDEKNKFIEII